MSNWQQFANYYNLQCVTDHLIIGLDNKQPDVPNSNFYCDHYHYSTIEISGEAADKFLHDLSTIDIYNIGSKYEFGSFCDQKGNVITNFSVFKHQNNYILRIPKDIVEIINKHFNKYKILYKVSIENISTTWLSLGIYLPSQDILDKLTINNNVEDIIEKDNYIIARKYPEYNVFEILTPEIKIFKQFWDILSESDIKLASNIAAQAFNLREKIVDISPLISCKYTPNHLEFEKFNGINFNKGCYLGQEIIARIKHRTSLQTTLQSFIINKPIGNLTNNSKILDNDSNNIGTLLSSIMLSPSQTLILAISKTKIDPLKIAV